MGWVTSFNVYFTEEEVRKGNPDREFKWPVEVYEDGTVYCPAPEEFE